MDARPRSDQVNRRFVVVSGLPGSGKTTIGRHLAALLHLPLIDKDDVLDHLYETRGIGDADWRRTLSRHADMILQHDATASNGAVVVSFWRVPGMADDSGTPTDWLPALSDALVHLHCICDPEIAVVRFNGRTRHPGHLDGSRLREELAASIRALASLPAPSIGQRIDVDTTVMPDVGTLAGTIAERWRRWT